MDVGMIPCMSSLGDHGGGVTPEFHSHPEAHTSQSVQVCMPTIQSWARGPMIHAPLQREMLLPKATRASWEPLTANIEAGAC